jgi:hypothetical protein
VTTGLVELVDAGGRQAAPREYDPQLCRAAKKNGLTVRAIRNRHKSSAAEFTGVLQGIYMQFAAAQSAKVAMPA